MDGPLTMTLRFWARALVCSMIMVGCATMAASAGSKSEELKIKMADIALLRQQILERSREAEQIRRKLAEQRETLINEASGMCNHLNIKDLKQAQSTPRVYYDIELLRIIGSYMDALERKIRFYRTGRDKLTYLEQSASDDLKMIATVSNLKIDALSTQISLVVNQYLSEAHIIQIDPDDIDPVPAESVWKSIAARCD